MMILSWCDFVVGLFIVLCEFSRLVGVVWQFENKITGCWRVWVWLQGGGCLRLAKEVGGMIIGW